MYRTNQPNEIELNWTKKTPSIHRAVWLYWCVHVCLCVCSTKSILNCCWVCKWSVWSSITFVHTRRHRHRHMCWRMLGHKLTHGLANERGLCVVAGGSLVCCMFLCQNREKTCLVEKVTNLKTDVLSRCSVCFVVWSPQLFFSSAHSLHSVWIEVLYFI